MRWCWSGRMEAARSACCIRHKGKAKGACGDGESPVPAASGAVFKWNRLLTTGNLCIRGLQTRNLFCIIIGRVTRFGLKLVAALLLCSAVLLGSQMLLPSAAATSQSPPGATIMVNQSAHQQVISVARSVTVLRFCERIHSSEICAHFPRTLLLKLRAVVHANHCFFHFAFFKLSSHSDPASRLEKEKPQNQFCLCVRRNPHAEAPWNSLILSNHT